MNVHSLNMNTICELLEMYGIEFFWNGCFDLHWFASLKGDSNTYACNWTWVSWIVCLKTKIYTKRFEFNEYRNIFRSWRDNVWYWQWMTFAQVMHSPSLHILIVITLTVESPRTIICTFVTLALLSLTSAASTLPAGNCKMDWPLVKLFENDTCCISIHRSPTYCSCLGRFISKHQYDHCRRAWSVLQIHQENRNVDTVGELLVPPKEHRSAWQHIIWIDSVWSIQVKSIREVPQLWLNSRWAELTWKKQQNLFISIL